MKLTVVPDDNMVIIDGLIKEGCDLSFLPDHITAIQFDGSKGEVESTDPDFDAAIGKLEDIPELAKIRAAYDAVKPPPPPSAEEVWELFKDMRESYLAETDWMVVKAMETGNSLDPKWATYREALRNLPAEVEAGKYPKPTWSGDGEDGNLVFNNWPVKPS